MGITKEPLSKTKSTWFGDKKLDWCYWDDGNKSNKGQQCYYKHLIEANSIIEIVADRIAGKINFVIGKEYIEGYDDKEITTGDLYFCCGASSSGTEFEIIN